MNYRPRNYSLRTAIGGIVVAGCIIAAMWWVMFAAAAAPQQNRSAVVYDERITLALDLPEQTITLPAAGGKLDAIEIIGTLGGWCEMTHLFSGEWNLHTTPFWVASVRMGHWQPLGHTQIQWSARESIISRHRTALNPLHRRVDALQHNGLLLTGDLVSLETTGWIIVMSGSAGVQGTGGGLFVPDGDGWLDLRVVYHYAELPSSLVSRAKRRASVVQWAVVDDSDLHSFGVEVDSRP